VSDLEAAHFVNLDIGAQDFEAYSLFLGLRAIGEEKRAQEQLHDFLKYRRSRRPVASALRHASPNFGLHSHCDANLTGHSNLRVP
jgi:hypothetical protein